MMTKVHTYISPSCTLNITLFSSYLKEKLGPFSFGKFKSGPQMNKFELGVFKLFRLGTLGVAKFSALTLLSA